MDTNYTQYNGRGTMIVDAEGHDLTSTPSHKIVPDSTPTPSLPKEESQPGDLSTALKDRTAQQLSGEQNKK